MREPSRWSIVVIVLAVLATAGFLLWYSGAARPPLTPEEQRESLARIAAVGETARGFLDASEIERFLAGDDGSPFYVVNLFSLRDRAVYGDGLATEATGAEALGTFSRAVLPLWASRGTHPVFVSATVFDPSGGWDLVTVVRYRSRRDYVDIVTSDVFVAALPHRLAATQENLRLTVAASLIPHPMWIVPLVCGVLVLSVHAVRSRSKNRAPHRESGAQE